MNTNLQQVVCFLKKTLSKDLTNLSSFTFLNNGLDFDIGIYICVFYLAKK